VPSLTRDHAQISADREQVGVSASPPLDSDLWLHVRTRNLKAALEHLRQAGVPVRDELELLGDFPGPWISDPAGNGRSLRP
jgi:hypothetical protein